MKAVIVAGGKAIRLGNLCKDAPKALIKIGKKPVIEHQILLLKRYNIKEIWVLLGHLGQQIEAYFGDGKKWGVKIHYLRESQPLGTAGSLKLMQGIATEDFLFMSGDIMAEFDVKKFIKWHKDKKNSLCSIVVHPSDHPFDSDLLDVGKDELVTSLLRRPHSDGVYFKNLSVASVFILSPQIFRYIPKNKKCDLEKDVLPLVLKNNKNVFAYKTAEYLKDIGTPGRLEQARKDYASGKIKESNFAKKRKAVFLDRDGTIDENIIDLCKIEDFNLYKFSGKAIKKINDAGYLAIVVTNQPMLAKGFLTENDLSDIHKKMETELARDGAKIDAIYYCPHHPQKGFPGEVPALKIPCKCRKPDIGMIKQAVRDFNIDLSKSFFIGDSARDIKTAENAGVKFIGVKTGEACKDKAFNWSKRFLIYDNVLEAVKKLFNLC